LRYLLQIVKFPSNSTIAFSRYYSLCLHPALPALAKDISFARTGHVFSQSVFPGHNLFVASFQPSAVFHFLLLGFFLFWPLLSHFEAY